MELKLPPDPGKNATKKDLIAFRKQLETYYSGLRRFHRKLNELDAALNDKEASLIKWSEELKEKSLLDWSKTLGSDDTKAAAKMVSSDAGIEYTESYVDQDEDENDDELDCGCTIQDALDGCDCSDCEIYLEEEACRKRAVQKTQKQAIQKNQKSIKNDSGDEVKFLEKMFMLKDRRKI
jgi:hypothetical protein